MEQVIENVSLSDEQVLYLPQINGTNGIECYTLRQTGEGEYTIVLFVAEEIPNAKTILESFSPKTPYNGNTLISWAMAQLFAAELIPHFAAFLDFANKGTDASATNFRAYATAVSQSIMAEQIVTKAIELGANIEE